MRGRWFRMVIKLKVTVGANEFSIEGDAPFSDIKPALEAWLGAVLSGDQGAVDAIQARVDRATQQLLTAIDARNSG
jgi:hypothetical protein